MRLRPPFHSYSPPLFIELNLYTMSLYYSWLLEWIGWRWKRPFCNFRELWCRFYSQILLCI